MSALRTGGWSVRPSFVPHGPTNDVTLLADERGLTQLAGIPDVAWQTPWAELATLQLVRDARTMALFATAAGVRYCWRNASLDEYEEWREVVIAHGGVVTRRRRRVGVFAVIAILLLTSFAGGIAAMFTGSSSDSAELTAARGVNLTLNDLPSGWHDATSLQPVLSILAPAPGQVITSSSTPTTAPAVGSVWARAVHQFESCMGVSKAKDRVFGAAGQMPDYQVSSPVFAASASFVPEVVSTTQYYATTAMVKRDTAEMSSPTFGACFAATNASLLVAGFPAGTAQAGTAPIAWRPTTFVRGWSRAGVVTITVPIAAAQLHLVTVVVTSGHFEVTLMALVDSWPGGEHLVTNLVNTLLARVTSTSSTAV